MTDREKALEAALLRFIADEEAGNLGHTDVGADWLIMAREAIATPAAPWSPPPEDQRPDAARLYRKKPVVIEAVQYDGTPESNRAIIDWTRGSTTAASMDHDGEGKRRLTINTLEGAHWVSVGDFIIKGVNGEFYPCKPDIFAKTYERAFAPLPQAHGLAPAESKDGDLT